MNNRKPETFEPIFAPLTTEQEESLEETVEVLDHTATNESVISKIGRRPLDPALFPENQTHDQVGRSPKEASLKTK